MLSPTKLLLISCSLLLCLLTTNASGSGPVADIVLLNAKVYSLNWGEPDVDGKPAKNAPYNDYQWTPDAEAIAIRGNTILYVGNNQSAKEYGQEGANIIDLKGATVIPGLVDSHVHIAELGEILQRINLSDAKTPQQAIDKLKAQEKEFGKGEWIIGQGWDEGNWANNYPDKDILDKAFPDNPVYLKSLHGFAVWVNSRALAVAGVDKKTKAPAGGEILKDSNGEPNGILLNRATTLIADRVPKPNVEQFAKYIHSGMSQMVKDGFVAVHEAGAESLHINAFEYLYANKQLPIRMYAMLSARDELLARAWQRRGPLVDPAGFLDVRSAKAYYDGALGSRGARLLQDYSDKPGHRGVSGEGYGFNSDVVDGLISSGFQVGIHAIGDAGNKEVLDYLSKSLNTYTGSKNLRHRVEHAQVIQSVDFKRFKELGLIASMEPPHAVEDKGWAEDRLGPDRIKGAYAWRTLRENKVPITFNSDLPGSDHSIFYALHAAVTRRDKQAQPREGWYANQALSIEESVRAYTSWAAYSAFREKQTGVLKPGFWADITVMDIDPFTLIESQPEKILDGKILMTIIDGKIKHNEVSKR